MVITLNPQGQEAWDSQYSDGEWDHLYDLNQLSHFSVVAGYFQALKYGGSLLDIGCGEGIFQQKLGAHCYSKYVGVDISKEAIRKASTTTEKNTIFLAKDAREFLPKESFDAIIFNESLYYFDLKEIQDLLRRYENFLKSDGVMIISMFEVQRNTMIWQIVDSMYSIMDRTKIINSKGTSWICKVLKQK